MSTIRRSTTGCWTCRVRRKKCDESGLPCTICETLSLQCYGYGARPDWMDGGDQETAYRVAFKDIVKRTKAHNRRASCSSVLQNMNTTNEKEIISPSLLLYILYINNILQNSAVAPIDEDLPSTEHDERVNLDEALDWFGRISDSQDSVANVMELNFSTEQHARSHGSMSVPTERVGILDDTSEHFWASFASAVVLTDDPIQGLTFNQAIPAFSNQLAPQGAALPSPLDTLSSESTQEDVLPPRSIPAPTSLPLSLARDEEHAWHYYTRIILPSMFYFLPVELVHQECMRALRLCQSSPSCTKHIYSQTEHFKFSELRRFGLKSHLSEQQNHEHSTISAENHWSLDQNCLLHILIDQINSGGKEWPRVVVWLSHNVSALERTCRESHFCKELFSYLEVLGSTMTGDQPNLAIHHLACIDNSSTLGSITGVESWLLDCLIRIIQLRKWKSDKLSKASLSMIELQKNSIAIERDLKRNRTNCGPDQYSRDTARSAFMEVYISAAAVFLQCTLSEPRPEIVEIQREVSRTANALRNLPDASLLKRLAWPVCIAGSMAIEADQQEFFKTLHEKVNNAWGTEENIFRALTVALECWRLRECAPANKIYDWTDSMKSLGCFWLLF